ncbi:MAG: WD40 repeat domain-containing protein [Saprospiraceae bacterium]|nr:WD40 repeat domain-containing protein [Saprospiraceae bacterium]
MHIHHLHTCTGHRGAVYTLAQAHDPRHFLSAGGDGWIVDWNLDDPDTGRLLAQTNSNLFSLCLLPGANQLVAGNMNGGIHCINLEKPDEARLIQAHRKGVFDLKVIGNYLLSAGGDGILTWWDVETFQPKVSLQLSSASLRCIAYAPQRNELAVGSSDNRIFFLDAGMPGLKGAIANAHGNSVFSAAYAPDGRTLITGGRDAKLKVWDAEIFGEDNIPWPGTRTPEQAAHLFTVNHITYSPDGSLFATASRDKTIKIWDAATCTLLKVIDTIKYGGHINSVNRLLWMNQVLISAGDDRAIMLWRVETD